MTLKTKHSSAPAPCLMVNAAAAHNSLQCTSARPSWTEALYFPNAISLFYRQAFSCQTQTFQILLLFCLQMKSYSILLVMILMLSLPNYRTKCITRNTASVTVASAPTVEKKFLAKEFQASLLDTIPTHLLQVSCWKKITGAILKLVNGESHMAVQKQGMAQSFQNCFPPQKAALKYACLFITKTVFCFQGKMQDFQLLII